MSSAAVSEATTQPRSSRPRTSGRMPCGSRAAYSVCSSIHTNENAPRTCGSSSAARSSTVWPGWSASSAVRTLVSLVDPDGSRRSSSPSSAVRSLTMVASSAVLIRLPLWASAIEPSAVGWKVGCALCQVLAPVVE